MSINLWWGWLSFFQESIAESLLKKVSPIADRSAILLIILLLCGVKQMLIDNTRRWQTLKQHTSYNCIHSSSNSNPPAGSKMKTFQHQVVKVNGWIHSMGMLTEACKLFWLRFQMILQVIFQSRENKTHEAPRSTQGFDCYAKAML